MGWVQAYQCRPSRLDCPLPPGALASWETHRSLEASGGHHWCQQILSKLIPTGFSRLRLKRV